MDADALGTLTTSLDAPMAIVTATDGTERAGCLIGFHSQASIEPLRYALWLSKANHTYRVALLTEFLGVHLLTEHDHELAELFGTLSGDDVDKLARCDVERGPEGVLLLTSCPNRMVVRRTTLVDEGGDHVCIATEPIAAWSTGPFTPLRLSDVADLAPGHEAEERPRPPTERAG
ncbi:MAG: flavin reductase [Acidimicrobiales bacterium]